MQVKVGLGLLLSIVKHCGGAVLGVFAHWTQSMGISAAYSNFGHIAEIILIRKVHDLSPNTAPHDS